MIRLTALYRGICKGCNRTCSFLSPAADTPPGKALDNLYCPKCHEKGRAEYQTYIRPSPYFNSNTNEIYLIFFIWLTILTLSVLGIAMCLFNRRMYH